MISILLNLLILKLWPNIYSLLENVHCRVEKNVCSVVLAVFCICLLDLNGLLWGEGDDRGWDGWMASLTRWTWVWVNSGSWWWTGRLGVLRLMGLQRVGHDWATELNWTELIVLWVLYFLTSVWLLYPLLRVEHWCHQLLLQKCLFLSSILSVYISCMFVICY